MLAAAATAVAAATALAGMVLLVTDSVTGGTSEHPGGSTDQARASLAQPADLSELLLPDLEVRPTDRLSVELDAPTGARLIRFGTTVTNLGSGPLEMKGESDPETGRTQATQRIMRRDGDGHVERFTGDFVFHPAHDHWHFESFTEFELWTYHPDGTLNRLVATTGKITFCLRDTGRVDPSRSDVSPAAYTKCGKSIQGISAGWQDTYGPSVPGQQLDVTNVPDGRYAIRTTVDPENRILEADDDNNSSVAYVQLDQSGVSTADRS